MVHHDHILDVIAELLPLVGPLGAAGPLNRARLGFQPFPTHTAGVAVAVQLMTTLEDHAVEARLVSVRVVEEIFRLHGALFTGKRSTGGGDRVLLQAEAPADPFTAATAVNYETWDRLHKLYPDLLRRLDDSDDTVRQMACRAWQAYVAIMCCDEYDRDLYRVRPYHPALFSANPGRW